MLALVPPTPRNLATYAAWCSSAARTAAVFLAAHCEGVLRLELGPGKCCRGAACGLLERFLGSS